MMTPPAPSAIRIVPADLDRPDHQAAVLAMVDAYSRDPMGDGAPLSAEARERLIPGLRQHPTTLVFLAYDGDAPVGVAVCFLGFSTFAAKPLVNLHDVSIVPTHRGRGLGRALLAAVEALVALCSPRSKPKRANSAAANSPSKSSTKTTAPSALTRPLASSAMPCNPALAKRSFSPNRCRDTHLNSPTTFLP